MRFEWMRSLCVEVRSTVGEDDGRLNLIKNPTSTKRASVSSEARRMLKRERTERQEGKRV